MFTFLITLIIIASLLLVLVVLAQNSKGGGLSSQFGGSTSQIMGVKRTGDILEKLTWGLAIGILVLSLSTNFFVHNQSDNAGLTSPNIERAQEQNVVPNIGNQLPLDTASSGNGGLEGLTNDSLQ